MRNPEEAPELLKTGIAEHGGREGEKARRNCLRRGRESSKMIMKEERRTCSALNQKMGRSIILRRQFGPNRRASEAKRKKMLNVGAQPMTVEEAIRPL